jgi:hypothetical protein
MPVKGAATPVGPRSGALATGLIKTSEPAFVYMDDMRLSHQSDFSRIELDQTFAQASSGLVIRNRQPLQMVSNVRL